jgi:hypothetical protein
MAGVECNFASTAPCVFRRNKVLPVERNLLIFQKPGKVLSGGNIPNHYYIKSSKLNETN